MKFESLHIYRGYPDTVVKGNIVVSGIYGKIDLNLTDEQARQLVAVVSEQLVEAAKITAHEISAEMLSFEGDQKCLP